MARIKVSLRDETFSQIEIAGGRPWPQEVRQWLNDQLSVHCSPERIAQFEPPPPIDKSQAAKARKEAHKLSKRIAQVDDLTRDLPLLNPNNVISVRQHKVMSAGLDTARQRLEYKHKQVNHKHKPGPRQDLWLPGFIAIVAEACSYVGITVSAEPSSINKDLAGPSRKFDGPFLRVLRLVHAHLPKSRQAKSESALDHRARDVGIPLWREVQANMSTDR
jgi:hypothetical protein